MFETFKIAKTSLQKIQRRHDRDFQNINKYDKLVTPKLNLIDTNRTRGNKLKFKFKGANHDFRKYSFSVRVPNIWNNLNNTVVSSIDTKSFQINLDKYWSNIEILYDYKALFP